MLTWIRNKIGFWLKPESERISELENRFAGASQYIHDQEQVIDGLNAAIGQLEIRNNQTRHNSIVILGSILVANGGKMKIEGNILDAVEAEANQKLYVNISEPADDGSRTAYLLEQQDEPLDVIVDDDDDEEFTDEEVELMEKEFLDDDMGFDEDDDFEDDDDCDCEHS